MRVIIYVEGVSDKLAMTQLLAPIIDERLQQGIQITFFEAPSGDRKESLLLKVPKKAVNVLKNDPSALVVILPDLYPPNKGFRHETFEQLRQGVIGQFTDALRAKGLEDDQRYYERLHVFCFKYDLEALLLAAKESFAERLQLDNIDVTWKLPVEDQNHQNPPRYIVEKLFEAHGQKYKGSIDAPLILGNAALESIVEACPQQFKPFVDFLKGLERT